jgi:hypothetical protein
MRPIAPDKGVEVRYTVPVATVLAALPAALPDRRLNIAVLEPFDSATTMYIAVTGGNLFSYGDLVRVLVRPTADGLTGMGIGAMIRTEVWSPLAPPGPRIRASSVRQATCLEHRGFAGIERAVIGEVVRSLSGGSGTH